MLLGQKALGAQFHPVPRVLARGFAVQSAVRGAGCRVQGAEGRAVQEIQAGLLGGFTMVAVGGLAIFTGK